MSDPIMQGSSDHWNKMEPKFRTRLLSEMTRLKTENDRLRKAGDELALSLAAFHLLHRGSIDTTTQPDIVAWNAAKEGKPIK